VKCGVKLINIYSDKKLTNLGKYNLLNKLGRGGYGTVYRAIDTVLEVERAVKVLHPPLAADPQFIKRFQKEAKTAARLDHPNIVRVYDLDEVDGRYFLVMEYMPGGSLKDLLKEKGRLPFERALEILKQVSAALDYAHGQGLGHRDVKPSNILFDDDGTAKLADFGFSKALSEASSASLSTSGGMIGTPAYMAPEVWKGGQVVGPQTDVYSLACVFYEMVTGEVLFAGESPPDIMKKHILDGPHFPQEWPGDVPVGIDGVLNRALSQNVDDRYSTSGVFYLAVKTIMTQEQVPDSDAQKQPELEGMGAGQGISDEKIDHKNLYNWICFNAKWLIPLVGIVLLSLIVFSALELSGFSPNEPTLTPFPSPSQPETKPVSIEFFPSPSTTDIPTSTPLITVTPPLGITAYPDVSLNIPSTELTTDELAQTTSTPTPIISNQIPSNQVCVYIVGQDENVTLKDIVEPYLKSGATPDPENYKGNIFSLGGLPWKEAWGDVWESNTLPESEYVALSFVKSKEECRKNKASLCNKEPPYNCHSP